MDLTLISDDQPTEVRTFDKGRFESCPVEHVGLVLSGQAAVKMEDGTEKVMREGEFFYVPPGHDSWVVGDEPYVSLHIMGSEDYAT